MPILTLGLATLALASVRGLNYLCNVHYKISDLEIPKLHTHGRWVGRRNGRSHARTHGRTVGRADGRTDGREDGRSDMRSDVIAVGCTHGRTVGRTDGRLDLRFIGRPDGLTDDRTVDQSDGRLVGLVDGRTNSRTGRRTGLPPPQKTKPLAVRTPKNQDRWQPESESQLKIQNSRVFQYGKQLWDLCFRSQSLSICKTLL